MSSLRTLGLERPPPWAAPEAYKRYPEQPADQLRLRPLPPPERLT